MITRLTQIILIAAAALLTAQTSTRKTFSTPEEARDALIEAAGKGLSEVRTLFGIGSTEIVGTGDEVQDKTVLATFNKLVSEKTQLEGGEISPNRRTLVVGLIEWPFSVPLTRDSKGRWFWDVAEGKAEMRRRVIGRNELNAIEICRGYVAAQNTYAETDRDGNGIVEYASKILSTDGKKDGLYWPGEDSPIAAAFAKATAEGYQLTSAEGRRPSYHGYYYKVLTAQGPAATGGEQDYLVKKLMIGGFGLVAWPAEYGISGIMTFIVNQEGVVYEKDLGPRTGTLAKAMTKFNPDKTWRGSPEEPLP
jgi:hypothetical protein